MKINPRTDQMSIFLYRPAEHEVSSTDLKSMRYQMMSAPTRWAIIYRNRSFFKKQRPIML